MERINPHNIGDYLTEQESVSLSTFLDRHFGSPKDLPTGPSRIKRIRMITTGLAVIATFGGEFLEREGWGSTIHKIHKKTPLSN